MPTRMRNRFSDGLMHGTLLKRSRQLRREPTEAESRLWSYLRLKNLDGARFRRQHTIEGFIVDFCCIKKRLIVEVDGSQHADNVAYDDERTRILERQGFRVLRFWNGDVMQSIDGVLETIFQALSGSIPSDDSISQNKE